MKTLRTPLALFALPAALVALAPAACVYDRAAILRGEWWRLVTGHWVHFSASHAAWNLLALLVAGAWLERARPGALVRYTLIAAPVIGLGLLAVTPTMACYGGLSGLAVGVAVLLALTQLTRISHASRSYWLHGPVGRAASPFAAEDSRRGTESAPYLTLGRARKTKEEIGGPTAAHASPTGRHARAWWGAALALITAKLAWETAGGGALFSDFGSSSIRPSVESHLLGAATAVAYFVTASATSRISALIKLPA